MPEGDQDSNYAEPSDDLIMYDSAEDDMWREFVEDDLYEVTAGMLMFAVHHDKYFNRAEYRKPDQSAEEWIQKRLSRSSNCYKMFRMSPTMFYRLHDVMVPSYGLYLLARLAQLRL